MSADALAARSIATWFGCGYWPWGPGTLGAAAAILIAVLFAWPPLSIAAAAACLLLPGVWASGAEALNSGRRDPGHVVVDEVAGQWITLAAAPVLDWEWCLAAFVLFRLFDIWKPAPVRQLEALPGGVGIMADDVMAGLYGAFVLLVTRRLNLW
jgi:phosphatidylglycerophosphatase A